jgi:uncharacterized protein (DUF433 family)
MNTELIARITIDSEICHGKPTVRNMRYPVEMILDLLSAGMSQEEILADYPALEVQDIQACLAFAAKMTQVKSVYKLVA